MKLLVLMTVLLVALAHPVMARHHKKAQATLSKSLETFSVATRAYRSGDYATALIHLRSLAEQGHAGAQGTLGWMYEAGRGLQMDKVMAYVWYDVAVANGHKKAHRNRYSAKKNFNEAQMQKARALSKLCLEKPTSCPEYSD